MLRKKLKMSGDQTELPAKDKEQEESHDKEPNKLENSFEAQLHETIWRLEQKLDEELMKINFRKSDKNIAAVYNPLNYAAEIHINFLTKFLKQKPKVLFFGMNPGLNGMVQSGVPFGHVPSVKDWMQLSGVINKPANEIASKPVVGFECKIEEPSGKRFWGLVKDLCGEPENFFRNCWVHNICPLAFLTSTGRNVTPTEIKGEAKSQLNAICMRYLVEAINIFDPKIIVSVGSYVNDCIKNLKKKNLISDAIECKLLPHPSPRALNNQNWVEKSKVWFIENDIIKYLQVQH